MVRVLLPLQTDRLLSLDQLRGELFLFWAHAAVCVHEAPAVEGVQNGDTARSDLAIVSCPAFVEFLRRALLDVLCEGSGAIGVSDCGRHFATNAEERLMQYEARLASAGFGTSPRAGGARARRAPSRHE